MKTAKERPIIMSAESVRAVLSGQKTQTRQVVYPKPFRHDGHWAYFKGGICTPYWTRQVVGSDHVEIVYPTEQEVIEKFLRCPYGRSGDRLWVRETWAQPSPQQTIYRADVPMSAGLWRSPILMPRRASRLLLEIVSVRVERLHAITEEDCKAEGIRCLHDVGHSEFDRCELSAVEHFAAGWDTLNAKRGHSWESNPWVWVVTFRRMEGS